MSDDPRRRTVEAAELIGEHYGVREQAEALRSAPPGAWEPLAVAMLAEAVAALPVEQPAGEARRKMRAYGYGGGSWRRSVSLADQPPHGHDRQGDGRPVADGVHDEDGQSAGQV